MESFLPDYTRFAGERQPPEGKKKGSGRGRACVLDRSRLLILYMLCLRLRVRESAIMAMNSLFVGFPLILLTV